MPTTVDRDHVVDLIEGGLSWWRSSPTRVRRGAPPRRHPPATQVARPGSRPCARPGLPSRRLLLGRPLRHEPTSRAAARTTRLPGVRLRSRQGRLARRRPPLDPSRARSSPRHRRGRPRPGHLLPGHPRRQIACRVGDRRQRARHRARTVRRAGRRPLPVSADGDSRRSARLDGRITRAQERGRRRAASPDLSLPSTRSPRRRTRSDRRLGARDVSAVNRRRSATASNRRVAFAQPNAEARCSVARPVGAADGSADVGSPRHRIQFRRCEGADRRLFRPRDCSDISVSVPAWHGDLQ